MFSPKVIKEVDYLDYVEKHLQDEWGYVVVVTEFKTKEAS